MKYVIRILAIGALLAATSCGSDTQISSSTTAPVTTLSATTVADTTVADTTVADTTMPATTVPATTVPEATSPVEIFFVSAEKLSVAGRLVVVSDPTAAVAVLLAGPSADESAAGLLSVIPDGTTLHGVEVAGNSATVDLSAAFESGGGSLSMMLRVSQVVFTVTQFDGIDTVYFRLDGQPIEMLGGEGLDVNGVGRLDFADLTSPLILLEAPLPGFPLVQPIVIRGMSNTFEAGINYQVLAADGSLLLEGYTMATSGTGTWGTFDHTIEALPAGTVGPVTLRVFEYSPKDGEPINVVEVTLT